MSKIKQIEEMARICHFYDDGICHLCEELLVSCDRKCDLAMLVENLYTAGYRKIYDDHQRQCACYALGCQMAEGLKKKVAREIFEEIEAVIERYINISWYTMEDVKKDLVELKKKYAEGGG